MSEKEKENSGNLMKNIKKPKIDTLDYGFKILSNGFNPEFVTTVINLVLDVCVLIALFKIRIEADEINE